jgi:hypothetical protein
MKKNYVCTWCNQQVAEEDFDLHSAEHYVRQAALMKTNPSTTMTSISSVSYVNTKEQI